MPYDFHTVANALEELLKEKVLIMENDVITQKRMVKDNEISEKRARAGRKGGQNSLGNNTKKIPKTKENFAQANAQAKLQANTEYENEYENTTGILEKGGVGEKEISKIERIMIDDEAQILTFLRNNRDEYPFLSVDVIRDAISDYFRKLEDEGVVYNTLKDARKHFSNWYKLKLKSEKQNGANKNNYSKNARPTFDEIGAAVEIGAGLAEAAKNR